MGENKKPTQCIKIIKYIEKFGSITQGQAYGVLGVARLASRINEIRTSMGIPIAKRWVKGENRWGEPTRYAEYYFPKEAEQE